MQLETERLWIRLMRKEDLQDVYEYSSQKEVLEAAGVPVHNSFQETEKYLEEWIPEASKHAIVLKEEEKVIGYISIKPDSEEQREDTKELGCVLNRNYHRRGIMSEAIYAVVNELFREEQIQYIWACCFQNNIASKGMIEKCGFHFQQEGTFKTEVMEKEVPTFEYRISKTEWQCR